MITNLYICSVCEHIAYCVSYNHQIYINTFSASILLCEMCSNYNLSSTDHKYELFTVVFHFVDSLLLVSISCCHNTWCWLGVHDHVHIGIGFHLWTSLT